MSYKSTVTCRLCKTATIELLNLGSIPLQTVDNFDSREIPVSDDIACAPLHFDRCPSCNHLQIREQVDPATLYKNFRYSTARTNGLSTYFSRIASVIIEHYASPNALVIDIGSNDGTFLAAIKDNSNCRILGVEPSITLAARANESGITTINAFFDHVTMTQIVKDYGKAQVVFVANTIANVENIDQFFIDVSQLIAGEGILWIETQDGDSVIDRLLIDTIYHEHLNYFRESSFVNFIEQFGFKLIESRKSGQKGGSLTLLFKKTSGFKASNCSGFEDSDKFNHRIEIFTASVKQSRLQVQEALANARVSVGFGASIGTHTLLSFYQIEQSLQAIFDDNPLAPYVTTSTRFIPCQITAHMDSEEYSEATMIVFAYRYWGLIHERHAARFRQHRIEVIKPLPKFEIFKQ
jgi:hypothetical protein